MDAMVTSRMPAGKKERGGQIIASLGSTPSKLISELYDFIIAEERLPDFSHTAGKACSKEEAHALYNSFIQETTVPVNPQFWATAPSDDDLLATALKEKYESLA